MISLYISEAFLSIYFVIPKPIANYYPFNPAKSGSTINIDQYEYKIPYKYNSQGFRDEEIQIKKNKEEKRILFLGDSSTEGFGIPLDERYSNMVIKSLGTNYKGINIGQLATNPDNYFDNLITFGLALKPDIVVMGISMSNDFMGGRLYRIPQKYKVNNNIDNKFTEDNSSIINFLQLKYVRTIISQVDKKEKKLLKRYQKGNFWDLYFGEKISKKFYLTNTGLDEKNFDQITKTFNKKIVSYYLNGKIIPTLLLEGVKDKLSEDKQGQTTYNDLDYKNTFWFINETQKILKKNKIKYIVLIISDVNQIYPTKFQKILKNDFKMKKIPLRLNQLEGLRKRLVYDLEKEHIEYIDATEELRKSDKLTYYLYDQHTNVYGHKILSDVLLKKIKSMEN